MRWILDKNFYTWQFLKDGSIIPGSMIDPNGLAVSPLTLVIDPEIDLAADMQEKLSGALKTLGLDIIINYAVTGSTQSNLDSGDLILTHWATVFSESDQMCGAEVLPVYTNFPVHVQTSMLENCVSSTSHQPTGSPEAPPLYQASGDIHNNNEFIPETSLILLTRNDILNSWKTAAISKYDIAWLVNLPPSWTAAWE